MHEGVLGVCTRGVRLFLMYKYEMKRVVVYMWNSLVTGSGDSLKALPVHQGRTTLFELCLVDPHCLER